MTHATCKTVPFIDANHRLNLWHMPTQQQLQLATGRGGWRPGAGRPRGPRPRTLHRARGAVPGRCPVHVTVRVKAAVPRLRTARFMRAFRRSLAACSVRPGFRVIHYSVQHDHVHLLIEAQGQQALSCGMKSLGARIGHTVNRVFRRRGGVLDGRYHHHVLRTPREVRHALAYVLLNARHHWVQRHGTAPPVRFDAASSGDWFNGWRGAGPPQPDREREVALPRTWLLTTGWRRHRLIDPAEVPGCEGRRARGCRVG